MSRASISARIDYEPRKRRTAKNKDLDAVIAKMRDVLEKEPGLTIQELLARTGLFAWGSLDSARSCVMVALNRGSMKGITYRPGERGRPRLYRTEDAPKETPA